MVKKVLVEAKKIATDAFNHVQEAIKNAQKSVSSAKTAVDGWNDGWSSYFKKPTKNRSSLVRNTCKYKLIVEISEKRPLIPRTQF